ncbi:MAG: hypothetical protein GY822_12330 [Deltaproteobacteria bacterium]|nr:hypothetical protein [Deltaproteobacteria bacterium]
MRQVRQMVDALLHIASLQKKAQHQEVLDDTGDLLAQLLGLKANLAERMSPQTLEMVLLQGGRFDLNRSLICGALLAARFNSHRRLGSTGTALQVSKLVRMLQKQTKAALALNQENRHVHEDNDVKNRAREEQMLLLEQMENELGTESV